MMYVFSSTFDRDNSDRDFFCQMTFLTCDYSNFKLLIILFHYYENIHAGCVLIICIEQNKYYFPPPLQMPQFMKLIVKY